MTPYQTYLEWLGIRNHFSQKRFQYGQRVNASVNAFEARNDKSFFYKAAKISNPTGFFVSNLIKSKNVWIGDLISSQESIDTYRQWKKRTSGLLYYFKNDLGQLKTDFNTNFNIDKNGSMPYIITLYFEKKISIETLTLIAMALNLPKYWKKHIKDPLIDEILLLIEKYSFFLNYQKTEIKKILKEYFA